MATARIVQKPPGMNKSAVLVLACTYLCCLQVGCGRENLSTKPDGGPDTGQLDPGPDGPLVVLPDGGTDTSPTTAPTLYAMSATLVTNDGGIPGSLPWPATHEFSVLIDWGANTATTGGNGLAKQVALVQSGASDWSTKEPLNFQLGLYGIPDLTYSNLTFQRGNDGCTATASGTSEQAQGDVIYTRGFSATMTGVVDRSGPQLAIFPTGDLHPLSFSGVIANEVLPIGTTAALDATGATLALTALPSDSAVGVSGFSLPGTSLAFPSKALAFATTYSLRVLPQAVDLAGNRATGLPSFSTLPDPGLFAQDGFEGPVNAYMDGPVVSADSTSLPIPAGSKALAIRPPGLSSVCKARFTVRMAVPAGATTVKFSYLTYHEKTEYFGWNPSYFFTVAVPNGEALLSYDYNLKPSPLPNPWTGALPGSPDNVYGNLQEAALPIPSGANGEILFDIERPCPQPSGPPEGMIVDNLRVE
jgi:hypothetical protein